MTKVLIKELSPSAKLFRDDRAGIAWVEDYSSGLGHSCHPNIFATGSVQGMKRDGYWGKKDRTVRSNGFIYNIDRLVVTDELDEIARQHCRCQGRHE